MSHPSDIEPTENPFALSIGDLMASLLLIFVLLLVSALLSVQEQDEKIKDTIARIDSTKQNLFNKLNEEFKDDFKKWDAEIDTSLTIRFKGIVTIDKQYEKFYFASDSSSLNTSHKTILDKFFLKYINILRLDEFKKAIKEIRIEGHTDAKPRNMKKYPDPYIGNMILSQERALSVAAYSLGTIKKQDERKWVESKLMANGLSYSRLIDKENDTSAVNRRVEFRFVTDFEEQIDKALRILRNENDNLDNDRIK